MAKFLAAAEEELVNAATVYEQTAVGLGGRLLDEIERTLTLLQRHPLAGRSVLPQWRGRAIRSILLPHFPFRIVYVAEPELLIVAVAHLRRRPAYWRRGREPR